MAYELRVVGEREPQVIEKDDGLLKRWEMYQQNEIENEVVKLDSWIGKLSDIKSFKRVSGSRANNEVAQEVNKEYYKNRQEFLKLSVKDKAKRLGFFRVVYYGFTEKKSEDVVLNNGKKLEDLAISIQERFFKENPKRMFCDYQLFKPLIKSDKCLPSVIGIISNQINTDKQFAR